MFAKLSVVVLTAVFLPLLAVATPWGTPTTSTTPAPPPVTTTVTVTSTATAPVSQCNTGSIDCCNSVQAAGSPAVSTLLGLLGVVIQDVNIPVGVTCSPITVGAGGTSGCSAETVCCENDNFNGVIAIGCVPINIAL